MLPVRRNVSRMFSTNEQASNKIETGNNIAQFFNNIKLKCHGFRNSAQIFF